MKPFFITVPHAGEIVPTEAYWLKSLPEQVLMCDSDRYVDLLYAPAVKTMGVPIIVADTHRYVVDLNRVPQDIDQDSVEGSAHPPGKFTTGFHWSKTTTGATLIKSPISIELHNELTKKYFNPFHEKVVAQFKSYNCSESQPVYHLDAHSMPSKGTAAHRDPGGKRAQIVVSDRDGTSCGDWFKNLVISAYESAGFEVAYNWPYKGGRITETYGQPQIGQHTIQVEMNRALYMDEVTKKSIPNLMEEVQAQLVRALGNIMNAMRS